MSLDDLTEKGKKCLEDREDIPGAPLWHMGKAAILDSKSSHELLQNTIDYLTCKGKAGKQFTGAEKEFMKELFEALWWGGSYHGYYEAAKLANHYVNGDGQTLRIKPDVYRKSVIVSDAMSALKEYIKQRSTNSKSVISISTRDIDFLRSSHSEALKKGGRSVRREGYLLSNGALLVEQNNLRLKNTDHRFHLVVSTVKTSADFVSTWSVKSLYDFEPFEKGYVTKIPLSEGLVLSIPDGLSHYLTRVGVAQEFKYFSEWSERWK